MLDFVFAPPPPPSVAIQGAQSRFPVRRIFCVGRNYAAHAQEMGAARNEPPFFFFKPSDTLVESGMRLPYPPGTTDFQHEVELVVAIGRSGSGVAKAKALEHVFGYAVGIDLTRRDLQIAARKMGRPWDWGKSFDFCAPCSPISPVQSVGHPTQGRIWLSVNGTVKQDADLRELIWDVPEIIAFASASMSLAAGDLIYTGTPAGVGALGRGDGVVAGIERLGELHIDIG